MKMKLVFILTLFLFVLCKDSEESQSSEPIPFQERFLVGPLEQIEELVVVDIDNDSYLDVVVSDFLQGLRILRSDGSGEFSDELLVGPDEAGSIFVRKFGSENPLDIIMHENDQSFRVDLQSGILQDLDFLSLIGDSYSLLASGDLDSSGDDDLVYRKCNGDTCRVGWLINNGNFSFNLAPETVKMNDHSVDSQTLMGLADFNNNSHLDFFTLRPTYHIYQNNETDGFLTGKKYNLLSSNERPGVADMDQDGDLDIIIKSGGDFGKLSYHANNGQLNFGPAIKIMDATSFYILADMNGDGHTDAIARQHSANRDQSYDSWRWLRNLGGGEFSIEFDLQIPKTSTIIDKGDFDNDGDVDLLVYDHQDFALYWLKNDVNELGLPINDDGGSDGNGGDGDSDGGGFGTLHCQLADACVDYGQLPMVDLAAATEACTGNGGSVVASCSGSVGTCSEVDFGGSYTVDYLYDTGDPVFLESTCNSLGGIWSAN